MSTSVEAIADARDVMRMLNKDPDAPWVAGLSPSDDLWADRIKAELEVARQERDRARAAAAYHAAATDEAAFSSHTLISPWLRTPLLFILLSVGLSAVMGSIVPTSVPQLMFPQSELVLWDVVKYGSGGRSHSLGIHPKTRSVLTDTDVSGSTLLGLVVASEIPYIVGTLLLCLRLGMATTSFAALCGVGCAILALAALAVDVFVFLSACSDDVNEPCNYPFISHWTAVAFRRLGPTAAVALSSVAIGLITTEAQVIRDAKGARAADTRGKVTKIISDVSAWASRFQWAIFSAIPFIGYIIYFAMCGYLQKPFLNGAVLIGGLEQMVVLVTVCRLWMQPPLRTVTVRPHLD